MAWGGRPSGEAASQIIARAMPRVFRRHLRRSDAVTPDSIQQALGDAAVTMNASMYHHSQSVPSLEGMGCTLASALINGSTLYHLHAGDSRIYLLRGDELFPLTTDHTYARRLFKKASDTDDAGDANGLIEVGEKRLLMQYMGKPEALVPEVNNTPLENGDRILLCSDGLTDPVPNDTLTTLLREHSDPHKACAALVDAANHAGGPDNITVAVIDFAGLRDIRPSDLERPPVPPRDLPQGIAVQTHAALGDLEKDLKWLLLGARAAAHPNRLTALAAAKRHLSKDAYHQFLKMNSSQSPLHAFHQCCTTPDSIWRQNYETHMQALKEPLDRLASGRVVLCQALAAHETAAIVRDLWTGWRRVEHRYFVTCQRDAFHESEHTLDILIGHMLGSVQTLAGLLTFLPRFMGTEEGANRPLSHAPPVDNPSP